MTVYFLTDGTYIKIGRSADVEKRVMTLQTGNTKKLEVLYTLEDVPASMEKAIHEICKPFKYRGEWFYRDCMIPLLRHCWYKDNLKEAGIASL